MAATSLADLHNFEAHFEDAAETFLDTAIGISCVGTLSESSLETPRVECQLQMGEALSPPILHGDGASPNEKDFSAYVGTFIARIITDNAVGQTANHAVYRSKTRATLMYSGTNWDSSTLPYYDLKWIRPLEASYMTDEDFNVTELTWEINFEIRRDAWPTS